MRRAPPVAKWLVRRLEEWEGRGTGAIRVFRAPGRVNLIGEHTDYNDGFVMPMAIQQSTWIAALPREDALVRVRSTQMGDEAAFTLGSLPAGRRGHWSDYVLGVLLELAAEGRPLTGADLMIHGEVPLGSGLSSSAALEVATALTFVTLAGDRFEPVAMATLCQRAENRHVGAMCGIMDPYISAGARAGTALLIDCRSLESRPVPLPPGMSVVIVNSQVKHSIAGGEYNQRRAQCEEGVSRLQSSGLTLDSLRDVTPAALAASATVLPSPLLERCRHVVTENARVLESVNALEEGDAGRFGSLMNASHDSLRDDYQVSCVEIDHLVEIARAVPGVAGARMTGGGFGGCTVNLVVDSRVEDFRHAVLAEYPRRTGRTPVIHVSRPEAGAGEVVP